MSTPTAKEVSYLVDPQLARLLAASFCKQHRVVLLSDGAGGTLLGMADPRDVQVIEHVENRIARKVTPVALRLWDIEQALQAAYDNRLDPSGVELVVEVEPLSGETKANAVDLVRGILGDAVFYGATDIHIERYPHSDEVRYRVDGILHNIATPITRKIQPEVVSRIKVMSKLDIAEKRVPQDGRFTALCKQGGNQRLVDVRVAVLPGPEGEDVALRLLDPGRVILDLAELGMEDEDLLRMADLIRNPEGMIINVGPTGAGKTTTLYSCLAQIADGRRKIITAEDPIEYRLEKVNQKQAGPKASMADLARATLRADPDVILIGEIRDEDTAWIAAKAAQTGHLVFSTLHVNSAIHAPVRLHGLGLPNELIGPTLLAVVAQRLIRRVCSHCAKQYDPDPKLIKKIPGAEAIKRFYKGAGCDDCMGTGYKGRVGLFELMYVDELTSTLIQQGMPAMELRKQLLKRDHRTMREDALRKLARGITTVDEIHRSVPLRLLDMT